MNWRYAVVTDTTLDDFLSQYSPQVRELALGTRALILRVFPDALEQVDVPSKIIAYGTGRKYADLVCAVAPFTFHVNLMFSQGAVLTDPVGLLQGSGKRARHVKITRLENLEQPAMRELLEEAVRRKR
ncbi:DUF1801 domain-containing protein [bacterium]|nr:MAG: DUF1801 domain-containing protein [bacterium]